MSTQVWYRILRSYCIHKCQKIHLVIQYQCLLLVAASSEKIMVSDPTYLMYVFRRLRQICVALCAIMCVVAGAAMACNSVSIGAQRTQNI